MAQALGAVVGQQLYRRVTQLAAALIGIGLASFWYPGSVAAASPTVSVSKQMSATTGFGLQPSSSIFAVPFTNSSAGLAGRDELQVALNLLLDVGQAALGEQVDERLPV